MLGELLEVVKAVSVLRPPPHHAAGRELTRWRWMVAVAIVSTASGLALHIALACGFFAPWYPGFAKADSQKKVEEQLQEMRAESIESQLWNLRIKQCEAWAENKPTITFTEKIREVQKKYVGIAGAPYQLPDCRELQSE